MYTNCVQFCLNLQSVPFQLFCYFFLTSPGRKFLLQVNYTVNNMMLENWNAQKLLSLCECEMLVSTAVSGLCKSERGIGTPRQLCVYLLHLVNCVCKYLRPKRFFLPYLHCFSAHPYNANLYCGVFSWTIWRMNLGLRSLKENAIKNAIFIFFIPFFF